MLINSITPNLIEACADVFVQSYNQAPWNYQWKLDDAIKYLSEYVSCDRFKGFALYEDEQLAGALLAHTKTWWTGPQLYVDELFISPQYQNRGFGKVLINLAEQYAIDNELNSVMLMTNKYMPAMDFYTKNDYIHAQPFVVLFKQPEC